MNDLLKNRFNDAFNGAPVRVSQNFVTAVVGLLKPFVSDLLASTETPVTKDTLIRLFKLENDTATNTTVQGLLDNLSIQIVRDSTAEKNSAFMEEYFSNDTVFQSFAQEFFPVEGSRDIFLNKLTKQQQLIIVSFVDYFLGDLVELIHYLDRSPTTSSCCYGIGKLFGLTDDSDSDDSSASCHHVSASVMYDIILHDEALCLILLPSYWEIDNEENKASSHDITILPTSLPGLIERSTDDDGFTSGLGAKLLTHLSTTLKTPFDHKKTFKGLIPNSFRRKRFLQKLLLLRLQDYDYLSHFSTFFLQQFDWKKFFSSPLVTMFADESDLWLNDKPYDESKQLSESNDDDGVVGDDQAFHDQWPLVQLFLSSCVEILTLMDFHTNRGNNGVTTSPSYYEQWIERLNEHIMLACDAEKLFNLSAGDDEDMNAMRTTTMSVFTALGYSVFTPNMTMDITKSREILRRTILQGSFVDDSSKEVTKVKAWIANLIKYGKSYPLTALLNFLTTDDTESKELIKTFFQRDNEMIELYDSANDVAKILSEQMFSYEDRVLLTDYLSSCYRLIQLRDSFDEQPKYRFKSYPTTLFNTSVELDCDSYDTISHCLIKKTTIPDENRFRDEDEAKEDNDDDEEEADEDGIKKGYMGLVDLLTLLQECGANLRELNIDDAHGIPLIGVAVQEGSISVVKYLLSIGVNIN